MPQGRGETNGLSYSTPEQRAKAFDLYLKDWTYGDIGKEVGFARLTIMAWQKKYEWEKLKEEAIRKANDNILDKYRKDIESISSSALAGAKIITEISKSELEFISEKHPKPPRGDEVRKELNAWGKLLLLSSNIQKNTIPEASEELSQLIYQELIKIRKSNEKPSS